MVTERNKKFKPPLTFFKNTFFKGPNIYDVRRERGWGGLEICHVFTYSLVFNQQIYCSFLRMAVRRGEEGVCGRHNYMILNITTCSDKKVTLLALVL